MGVTPFDVTIFIYKFQVYDAGCHFITHLWRTNLFPLNTVGVYWSASIFLLPSKGIVHGDLPESLPVNPFGSRGAVISMRTGSFPGMR